MQSRGARIGVVVVAAAVVVVLFFVLRDSGEDDGSTTTSVAEQTTTTEEEEVAGDAIDQTEKPKPEPPPEPEVAKTEIEIEGGQPVGGVKQIQVPVGEKAEIVVSSPDTTDHVHLHGYDIFSDLTPEKPAKIAFTADIEGVFEMELEDTVVPIAEVTVK